MNNLRTPPSVPAKTFPPIFFMVHLLHRLYGVDAPVLDISGGELRLRWLLGHRCLVCVVICLFITLTLQ